MYKNILFSKAKEGLDKLKIEITMENLSRINNKNNFNSVCNYSSMTIIEMIEEYERNLIGKW
ncbi:hypothetical protein [Clostridium sp. DJ247]|uniref:hypothetical protein n=1 Tax=Clostridium sp. DJ247 TaxID=2726188 RepID=UPI001623CD08|nr:hypothetical protein [Clostridium sp. DJ247]MBC2581602.1 hypothetical protein [Clostridium sp. DJ247]